MTAVSESTAAFHEKKCHLPAGSIKVILNAVEKVEGASAERCREFLAQFDVRADKVIGCVGRLDAMKGYSLMLERLDALSKSIPAGEIWLILILGDGPDRKKLEAKAGALPYSNLKVRFAGFQSDAASLMNAFDVFFTPSLCEGYGLAVAEAMMLGLPIAANNADALPELCKKYDGDTFLFDIEKDRTGSDMAKKLIAASQKTRTKGMEIMKKDDMIRTYIRLYCIILKKRQKKT